MDKDKNLIDVIYCMLIYEVKCYATSTYNRCIEYLLEITGMVTTKARMRDLIRLGTSPLLPRQSIKLAQRAADEQWHTPHHHVRESTIKKMQLQIYLSRNAIGLVSITEMSQVVEPNRLANTMVHCKWSGLFHYTAQ